MGWKNWSPILFSLAFLHLRSFICEYHNVVKECPVNETAWEARSQNVTCKSPLVYHCIQDGNRGLMETCMIPYKVNSYVEGGCPWASYIAGRGSILGVEFYTCEGTGCPQKDDSDYWSNQLYKYPRCLQLYKKTTEAFNSTESTLKTTLTTAVEEGDGNIVAVVVIPKAGFIGMAITVVIVIIVLIAILVMVAVRYNKKLNASTTNIEERNNLPTDPLNPKAPSVKDNGQPMSRNALISEDSAIAMDYLDKKGLLKDKPNDSAVFMDNIDEDGNDDIGRYNENLDSAVFMDNIDEDGNDDIDRYSVNSDSAIAMDYLDKKGLLKDKPNDSAVFMDNIDEDGNDDIGRYNENLDSAVFMDNIDEDGNDDIDRYSVNSDSAIAMDYLDKKGLLKDKPNGGITIEALQVMVKDIHRGCSPTEIQI